MANLLPLASSINAVSNRDERSVVEFLLETLDDSWYLYPGFRLHEHQADFESDILLVSPHFGVGIVEVKGGNIHIEAGRWVNTPEGKDPVGQAVNNSYRVAREVEKQIGLEVKVAWAIWLPKAKAYEGRLPAGLSGEQLILGAGVDDHPFVVENFFAESAPKFKLLGTNLEKVINALCPSVKFFYDPQFEARRVRERLETILHSQLDAVASLEKHKRIFVQGGAGTGKTALAIKWAYSALHEDEPKRVLLTCYNEPLGAKLGEEMALFDSADEPGRILKVGAFLSLMASLPGMPIFALNPTEDDYWPKFERHLLENVGQVELKFDRVIVDECQDFDPDWLAALESLLDIEGDNELYFMGDANQALTERGFVAPTREGGWVLVTLPRNVRNVRAIAALAYRAFRGAKAVESPEFEDAVVTRAVAASSELWPEANLAIQELLDKGAHKSEILVIASSAALRDDLRKRLGLVAYEARGGSGIICETPYRAKGLEFNYVVLVLDSHLDNSALYVALTRAVNKIYIVSSPAELERIGVGRTGRLSLT